MGVVGVAMGRGGGGVQTEGLAGASVDPFRAGAKGCAVDTNTQQAGTQPLLSTTLGPGPYTSISPPPLATS